MHSAAASQSKLCELGSLVLTSLVRDHGQGEKQRVERKKKGLTCRPGAYLVGMAGQCPRG
jgi:aerobic-type carbon monoxide dehydrogenase small subunit (CoxS/CutS family)